MKIGIEKKINSYTPEAFAYQKFLQKRGHEVFICEKQELDNDGFDVSLYFMGVDFFNKNKSRKSKVIHEYHSLSTPSFAKIKNFVKRKCNSIPDARIFLNDIVRNEFNFSDNKNYINRDMGVDKCFFESPAAEKEYNIVYSGSLSGRSGLIECILKLSKRNKLLLIGNVSDDIFTLIKNNKNIIMTGRLSRDLIPELYQKSIFGLNYTPDIYPFNIQTSTKTLEYAASGIGILSNRYRWISEFDRDNEVSIDWLDESDFVELNGGKNSVVDRNKYEKYEWNNLLIESDFASIIESR